MHYLLNALRSKTLYLLLFTMILLGSGIFIRGQGQHDGHSDGEGRPETSATSPIALNPARGSEIGFVYEAFLSPHQEGDEEDNIPPFTPSEFRSTAPSVPRNERTSHGHAVLQFPNDLSRAYIFLAVENVNPEDLVMLHIHCGRPGQLGPILIDFALAGDIRSYLADGVMAIEVTNEDIVAAASQGSGLISAFTSGCPIIPTIPNDKVKTIAGMELIARQGELYFNLHTAGQTFYGDIRGQFYAVDMR